MGMEEIKHRKKNQTKSIQPTIFFSVRHEQEQGSTKVSPADLWSLRTDAHTLQPIFPNSVPEIEEA